MPTHLSRANEAKRRRHGDLHIDSSACQSNSMGATHDVASLLLDHPRKEGLQRPEVRQCVDGEGPVHNKWETQEDHAVRTSQPQQATSRE